jgi:uncharacterized protein YjbI with pentapeptide repeats
MPLMDEPTLRLRQLELANQQLELAIKKSASELKPESWWSRLAKNVVAVGGIVTILATGTGIWDSYRRNAIDREHTRVAEAKARIDESIKRIDAGSVISKMSSIAVLSGYLDKSNQDLHRQILYTFASLMANEHDEQVQRALTDLISTIPAVEGSAAGPIKKEDWEYFLGTLISQNRALAAKGSLAEKRQFYADLPVTDIELAARGLGKLITQIVRKKILPEYTDYSGIYCVGCDFSDVAFKVNTNFSESILDNSNFNRATLQDALFDNSQLLGSTFIESNLNGAKVRSLGPKVLNLVWTGSLDHIFESLDSRYQIQVQMPNFSCADLENADFDQYTLFTGILQTGREYTISEFGKKWYSTVPSWIVEQANQSPDHKYKFASVKATMPKFYRANISGTDLRRVNFLSVSENKETQEYYSSTRFEKRGGFWVFQGQLSGEDFDINGGVVTKDNKSEKKSDNDNDIQLFQTALRASMFSTRAMDKAKLSEAMDKFLKTSQPSVSDFRSEYLRSFGKIDTDPDFNCRPR